MALEPNQSSARLTRLRAHLAEQGMEAAILTLPESIYYLTGYHSLGYDRPRALLVDTVGATLFLPPDEAAGAGDLSVERFAVRPEATALAAALIERLPAGARRVALEMRQFFLSPALWRALATGRPTIEWVDGTALLAPQRLQKGEAELSAHERAGAAAVAGLRAAFRTAAPGVTENEIAGELFAAMLRAGSEYPASPPYVTSGPRTALPHATWEGRRLKEGDLLLVEHAAAVDRLHTAVMRTACLGQPTPAQRAAYAAVRDSLEAMTELARPGITAASLFAAGLAPIRAAGFERQHGLGYSIGVAFPPGWNEAYLFPINSQNQRPLLPGMLLYLMPSIHTDSWNLGCGDTILITADGARVLTPVSRDLEELLA